MGNPLAQFAQGNPIKSINNAVGEAVRQITPGGKERVANDITNNVVTPAQTAPATLTSEQITKEEPSIAENYRVSKIAGRYSRGLGTFGEAQSPEETIATISVATDTKVLLSNYSQFFLQSVSEGDQEKYQVVETFTAYYVFFFGRRPPVYRISGLLLNDSQFNWMNDFRYAYNNLIRGTAAAEVGARVIISYDKRVISCFPLSLNISQDAASDKGVPFTMDLLVISHDFLDYSTDLKKFMDNKQNELRALKNQIQDDIKRMSKNVNSEQAFIKQLVLKKNKAASSVSKTGEKQTANPGSEKKNIYNASASAEDIAGGYISQIPGPVGSK